MKLLLLLIPLITAIAGVVIYKYQDGKQREIFRLDAVQFTYLFLLTPTLYVWGKSFLFYLLRNELDLALSVTDIFVIDTVFSVLAFVIFAALAMHSLTKTFWIRRHHDPEFDIFHLSEYFHLHWTHLVIWIGMTVLISFVSFANIFVPIDVVHSVYQFYTLLFVAVLGGALVFMAIWGSDPGQGDFMRIMKLVLMLVFVLHVVVYFVFDPTFKMEYGAYWFSLFLFAAAAVASFFFDKSPHAKKVRGFWLHAGWGENIQIFPLRKKRKK